MAGRDEVGEHGRETVGVGDAAQAPAGERGDRRRLPRHQHRVDPERPEVVHDDADPHPVRVAQEVVDQGGLAHAEVSGDEDHRDGAHRSSIGSVIVRPLEGIRVLDLSRVLAGPYATQWLGEMGADVIKVEPPGRRRHPRLGPAVHRRRGRPQSLYYLSTNRNKRGIVLDLKTEQGRDAVRRLAARSDVLVENFRPGTLQGWGLGYESLAAENPGLIHLAVSGFGQTGPYRERAGYDVLAQAMGGLMSLTGEPDGPPTKVGLPIADLNAGTWAIIGVLMALRARDVTGRGQYLDVSLLDAQTAWHSYAAQAVFHDERRARRLGVAHPTVVPYQAMAVRRRSAGGRRGQRAAVAAVLRRPRPGGPSRRCPLRDERRPRRSTARSSWRWSRRS